MKKIHIKKYLFLGLALFIVLLLQIFFTNGTFANDCPAGTSYVCDAYYVNELHILCSVGNCDSRTWAISGPCSNYVGRYTGYFYGSFCSDSVNHVFCTNGAAYNVPCQGYCYNSSQCMAGLTCSSNTCVNTACPSSSNCLCINQASCSSISAPNVVQKGQNFSATVRMRNTGTKTWITDSTPHRLGSQDPQDNLTWGLGRVSLPGTIYPNNTASFGFTARAPNNPGTYYFSWKMVEDGLEWFGSKCSKMITVVAPAPTVYFSASPTSINYNSASTLSWSSSNASSCTASGAWSGGKSTSGSQSTGNITSTRTYTLTCTGAGGSASKSVAVNVGGPASCSLPWGGIIAHNSSVTAYAASSVPCGSSCSSQTRTCSNGILSNSYTKPSCSVAACPCSLPWGGTIASGSSVTAYAASSVPCGSSCSSQTRTCSNGSLSGSYTNYSCSVVACPTLSVSLSANPTSGNSPLNDIDLTATAGGSQIGTINYTFYCNRSDSGTNITSEYAAKYDGISTNPKTIADVCDYSSEGTYTAKVIIERGSLASESRQTITVSAPPCSCGLWGNQGCEISPCSLSEMKRTRTCTPSGCDTEEQCFSISACQHKECNQDSECVSIPGSGEDECDIDGDCVISLPTWEEITPW